MNINQIEKGKMYHYKQVPPMAPEVIFEAIIKITDVSVELDTVRGKAVFVIDNAVGWADGILDLFMGAFIKEVSEEKDPEYFL